MAINFSLRTAFAASHRFWVVMFLSSLVSRNFLTSLFISSVTCWLFRNVFLNSMYLCFLQFFSCNWHLVSSLWLEKMLDKISIFLNFLRFYLWPKMWSIMEKVPSALQKKIYSSAFVSFFLREIENTF